MIHAVGNDKSRVQSPEIYHLLSLSDLCYSVCYLGWYSTHPSPKGRPLEPQSDKQCHKDNPILFSKLFYRYRLRKLPEIYNLFGHSDLSYSIPLLLCYISHPSAKCIPRESLSNQKYH